MTVHQWGKDGSRFLQGLSEISEVKIIQLQRHGRAVADMKSLDGRCSVLVLRESENGKTLNLCPGHDFVRGCNERTFRVSFSHFNDLSTISHVNQFQDFHHVHFSTICQQFRMPTHFNIFNNLPNLEVANDVQQFFGRICGRKICESLVRGCTVYCTTLNLLEHLNLSWNNACACEHSRNLVGTI